MEEKRINKEEEKELLRINFKLPIFYHILYCISSIMFLISAISFTGLKEIEVYCWIFFAFCLISYIVLYFGVRNNTCTVTNKMIKGRQFIIFGYKSYSYRFDTISDIQASNILGLNSIRINFTQGYLDNGKKEYRYINFVANYQTVLNQLNSILAKVKSDKDVSTLLSINQTEALNNIALSMKSGSTIDNKETDFATSITRLKNMLDDGIISQEEFEELKKKILEKI